MANATDTHQVSVRPPEEQSKRQMNADKERMQTDLHAANERMKEELDQLREDMRSLMRSTGNMARAKLDPVEGYIHENPLRSLMIAAGAGMLLGAIFKSRD